MHPKTEYIFNKYSRIFLLFLVERGVLREWDISIINQKHISSNYFSQSSRGLTVLRHRERGIQLQRREHKSKMAEKSDKFCRLYYFAPDLPWYCEEGNVESKEHLKYEKSSGVKSMLQPQIPRPFCSVKPRGRHLNPHLFHSLSTQRGE